MFQMKNLAGKWKVLPFKRNIKAGRKQPEKHGNISAWHYQDKLPVRINIFWSACSVALTLRLNKMLIFWGSLRRKENKGWGNMTHWCFWQTVKPQVLLQLSTIHRATYGGEPETGSERRGEEDIKKKKGEQRRVGTRCLHTLSGCLWSHDTPALWERLHHRMGCWEEEEGDGAAENFL